MTETTETLDTSLSASGGSADTAVMEALLVIDEALARCHLRELISADEVSDLLLDIRMLLTAAGTVTTPAATN